MDNLKFTVNEAMEFSKEGRVEEWEKHINKFQKLIDEGWDMPPLIVQHHDNRLTVNDGNHRLEAMRREGVKSCFVIIWNTDYQDDIRDFE